MAGWDVLFSGKQTNKAHVTLGCEVNGEPQPDKWKHMVRTSETIECQHKDANRGANLFADHEDSRDDENEEKQGQLYEDCTSLLEPKCNVGRCSSFYFESCLCFQVRTDLKTIVKMKDTLQNLETQEFRFVVSARFRFHATRNGSSSVWHKSLIFVKVCMVSHSLPVKHLQNLKIKSSMCFNTIVYGANG